MKRRLEKKPADERLYYENRHHDMQHEELLICNPETWAAEVGKCCEI